MLPTKCLIFDFDGVIVDSFDASYKISQVPLNVESKTAFRRLFNGSIANAIKSKLSPSEFRSFFNRYAKELPAMPIVPGISDVIREVSKRYLLAIVSSTTSSAINNFLKSYKLEKYFAEVLGINDSPSKEEKIRDLLRTHNLTANDCIMITDTIGDIEEAKRAGVKTIGVTWGYHNEATLRSSGPSALAHTPVELVQLVQL